MGLLDFLGDLFWGVVDFLCDLWLFDWLFGDWGRQRRYARKRERAMAATQIAIAREQHFPEPKLPGSSL